MIDREALDECLPLWTTKAKDYVLVDVQSSRGSYVIFNNRTRTADVIEDEEVEREVIRRMIAAGVPIINSPPPR